MIVKIRINQFENNLLKYFTFLNKESNYNNITSFTEPYILYNKEINRFFKNILQDYNTIIFIEEKEKINLISTIIYQNVNNSCEDNLKYTDMKNKKSFYLLNIRNYNELKSLEKYIDDDQVDIYTKIKIKDNEKI